jgi:hypothetical protein
MTSELPEKLGICVRDFREDYKIDPVEAFVNQATYDLLASEGALVKLGNDQKGIISADQPVRVNRPADLAGESFDRLALPIQKALTNGMSNPIILYSTGYWSDKWTSYNLSPTLTASELDQGMH